MVEQVKVAGAQGSSSCYKRAVPKERCIGHSKP
jgi:hypothetical protein